jgi:hypothetical protein
MGPNWANLVAKGRVKAFGVPWNEAEMIAVFQLHIPADYVRRGCLTLEELEATKSADEKAEKKGEKPVDAMSRDELANAVRDGGNDVSDAAPVAVLRDVVKLSRGNKKKHE